MIVCTRCGFHNEEGAAFCGSCGAFLEWAGEQLAGVAAETQPGEAAVGAEPPAEPVAAPAPDSGALPTGEAAAVEGTPGVEAAAAEAGVAPGEEEEAARAREEAAAAAAAEAEARRAAEDAVRAREEAERRAAEEAAARARAEEELRARLEAAERAREEAERRAAEEAARAAAEQAARREAEETARSAAEEAARQRAEAEAAARAEAERRAAEEAAARARAEEEAARSAAEEAARQRAEAEAAARAEAERRAAEEAAARARAEEEAAKAAAAAQRAAALVAKPPPPAAPPPVRPVPPAAAAPGPASGAPAPRQPEAQKPAPPVARPQVTKAPPSRQLRPGDLICGQCGEGNDPQRKFCRRCGASLVEAEVVPVPWWRRLLARRRRPVAAGERPMRRGSTVGGRRVRRGLVARLRTLVSVLLVAATLLAFVGYVGPWRSTVNDRIADAYRAVRRTIAPTYHPVRPTDAVATSAAPGHPPVNAIDQALNTFWAADTAAERRANPNVGPEGEGSQLIVRFAEPVDIDQIGFTLGASDKPEDFLTQPRPHVVHVTFQPSKVGKDVTLKDTQKFQRVKVSARGVTQVEIQIVSVYGAVEGGKNPSIAEVEFFAKD
jgi:hypothetical protein